MFNSIQFISIHTECSFFVDVMLELRRLQHLFPIDFPTESKFLFCQRRGFQAAVDTLAVIQCSDASAAYENEHTTLSNSVHVSRQRARAPTALTGAQV